MFLFYVTNLGNFDALYGAFIISVLSISMQLFRLNPRSQPFAFLLGIPPEKGVDQ